MTNDTSALVSVIVPTRNRANYLSVAIDSILKQTYKKIEIIIIADNCIDNTTKIVTEYQKKHPQIIQYLEFNESLGGAKARNIGIDHARGEYIAFLDDDDYWQPQKLQIQVPLLESSKYSIISCAYQVFGLRKYKRHRISKIIHLKDTCYENELESFSFCITKKSYIAEYRINEALNALQDWDLWLKILQNTQLPAYIMADVLSNYRAHNAKISTNYAKVIDAQKLFLKSWHSVLGKKARQYHKMRTQCLALKLRKKPKLHYVFYYFPKVLITVFNSPYRYNKYTYAGYLTKPFLKNNNFIVKAAALKSKLRSLLK